jgi:hypothetical protein
VLCVEVGVRLVVVGRDKGQQHHAPEGFVLRHQQAEDLGRGCLGVPRREGVLDVQRGDGPVEELGGSDVVGMALGLQPLLVDLLRDGDEAGPRDASWIDAEAVEQHDREDHAAD